MPGKDLAPEHIEPPNEKGCPRDFAENSLNVTSMFLVLPRHGSGHENPRAFLQRVLDITKGVAPVFGVFHEEDTAPSRVWPTGHGSGEGHEHEDSATRAGLKWIIDYPAKYP
jgi:hypothetical protein